MLAAVPKSRQNLPQQMTDRPADESAGTRATRDGRRTNQMRDGDAGHHGVEEHVVCERRLIAGQLESPMNQLRGSVQLRIGRPLEQCS